MLASAVHIVVHVARLNDGTRRVMSISEVGETEGDYVEMHDIFTFDRTGMSQRGRSLGSFRATGYQPRCLARLRAYGVRLRPAIFEELVEVLDG
jgi:pilus assembly protein CpaF